MKVDIEELTPPQPPPPTKKRIHLELDEEELIFVRNIMKHTGNTSKTKSIADAAERFVKSVSDVSDKPIARPDELFK